MKKALLPLLLVIPLVACEAHQTVNLLKADTNGHYTEAQLNYLTNDDPSNTSPYNGNMSVSKPEPVTISWESTRDDISYCVELYKDMGEEGSLGNIVTSYVTDETSFDFYNPIFHQKYYVRVTGYKDGTSEKFKPSDVISFVETPTVKGPRNIYADGVENFRDIGGWGYIKQGMLYRSGRFNEDKEETVKVSITEEGLHEVNNHLKIKTEIDLRRTSNNEVGGLKDESVLGKDVNYIQLPMAYGGNNILTFKGKLSGDDEEYNNPGQIKWFFKYLSQEENYPINFHCSIGKDRTGCMAYLVEGLLGFDKETMYRDYMFTNFANAGMCKLTDITDRYGKTLDDYENGNTLQEKIYNYLNQEIGVPTEYLDKVIEILKA